MSVIPFQDPRRGGPGAWSRAEMGRLVATADALRRAGLAGSWEVGSTEHEDPQFFVLGTAPDEDCVLCVSRVGPTYLLQDGRGRLLREAPSIAGITDAARAGALPGSRSSFVARCLVALGALRVFVEERAGPLVAESTEILARLSPQIAAFA